MPGPSEWRGPRIGITHGRDQVFQIPGTMEREWSDALRHGLESAGMSNAADVPMTFAFYGDLWRPDRRDLFDDGERGAGDETEDERAALEATGEVEPSGVQSAFADDVLIDDPDADRLPWGTIIEVVRALQDRFPGVDNRVLSRFLADLDEYFRDDDIRERVLDRLRARIHAEPGPTILLGHSMGSIVAYDLVATDGAASLGIEALVTFGSPLGLTSIRRRVADRHPGTPYPAGLRGWLNVFNPEDFATGDNPLAPLYRTDGEPAVFDVASRGRPPTLGDPGRGHEPTIYLSSIGLAEPLRRILDAQAAMAGDAGPEPETNGDAPPEAVEPQPEPEGSGDAPADDVELDDDGERGEETAAPTIRPEDGEPVNAPIGGPAAGERTVEKTASADFPPVVLPRSTHKLRVAIASEAIYGVSGTVTITAPADQRSVDLRVGVSAEHFDIVADDAAAGERRAYADIVVDLDDPKHVAEADFRLTAHDLAEATESNVFVTFFRKNLPVGHLALATTIDPTFEPQRSEIRLKLGEGRPRDPDYVLLVADRSIGAAGTGPFAIAVHREGTYFGKPLGELKVAVGALEHSQALLQQFRLVREETDKEERIRRASQLGVQLWEEMPEAFRTFYWDELHDQAGASIAIYSEEPYFPWELIRPQRETPAGIEEADFLGIRYSMARWTANVSFPDPLVVERFSVIAPDYPDASGYRKLPKAQEEATALEAAFGARRTPANRAAVRGLLESQEGIQLIHFAGHGEFKEANANASSIGLEDGDLTTGDLTRAQLGRASHPFVFLNACEVGDRTFALTRIGGWAASFVARGFSGFVGPYWAVNDRIAGKASMAFYDALANNRTVGEAIQSVRRRFYDDPEDRGHPSWLAYTLHCQPNIHVGITMKVAAGAPAAAGGGDL